jgi:hypothetical protein
MNTSGDLGQALFYILCRYIHIVCTTLLVGGTLFYEMVVPVAIGDLRSESQLLVFGRARWMFRWIVWLCATLLIATGIAITYQYWSSYTSMGEAGAAANRPGWWWAAHAAAGAFAISISLMLTIGSRPPDRPLTWMRFNLILLLVVMFLASATRHVRDTQASAPPAYQPSLIPLPPQTDDRVDPPTTERAEPGKGE